MRIPRGGYGRPGSAGKRNADSQADGVLTYHIDSSDGPSPLGPLDATQAVTQSAQGRDSASAELTRETALAEDELATLERGSVLEVFLVATKLGFTCFGGPIAHLGYFRQEYVLKRKWLAEETYADLVALCQFLPGAASSKVGMSIGILRAGLRGGVAAFVGFTMPSAIALTVMGLVLRNADAHTIALLHGLKVVAVAIVASAVWGMAKTLAPDGPRATIALASAAAVVALPTSVGQVSVIALAALIGWRFLRQKAEVASVNVRVPIPRWLAISAWILLIGLLVGLPIIRGTTHIYPVAMFDSFYQSGALVFGGGHVILPLLQAQLVPHGWIGSNQFLAGYGLAQAVPGPLFTFAGYLGAAMNPSPHGVLGAAFAVFAIFLPSMLLVLGTLPLWGGLRARPSAQAVFRGVGAAVVGILLAALYNPVWTSAILRPADFALAVGAFGLLTVWKSPPWLVVALTTGAGALIAQFT
jgi:chromate transporter